MTEIPAVDRSVNLVRLLRRLAHLKPSHLHRLVWECAEDSPLEVRNCINEYGPFAGLVRLAPLFPHGYLDTSGRVSASSYAHNYRTDLAPLLQELNRVIPPWQKKGSASVLEPRLDDIIISEVSKVREEIGDPSSEDLLERLFAVYDVVPRLPALAELTSQLKKEVDLSDAVLVAHQHILGSVVSQFEALWELGLDPSRTFVAGKAYSTNRLAALYLRHKGCSVRSGLRAYGTGSTLLPAVYQTENDDSLGHFFAKVVRDLPDQHLSRLVVLDDGGLVLAWLNRAPESGLFSEQEIKRLSQLRVVGVEQTTFGQRLLNRLSREPRPAAAAPSIPVANVAETRLKMEKESSLIAHSVVEELDAWLHASDAQAEHVRTLSGATVGVVGFGVVGSWICRVLHDRVQRMIIFDKDARKSSIARSFGYQVAPSLQHIARECSVIVGCTGAPDGVELEAKMLSPGTVLASASSGNYEFARVFITGTKERRPKLNPEMTPERPASAFDWVHSIYPVDVPEGRAFVLNGGFPVNFTGAIDPIRAEEIELTRCLITLGVASALRQLGQLSNFGSGVELAPIDESVLNNILGL
jgi:S-adenosylhomocysteine hydrolase